MSRNSFDPDSYQTIFQFAGAPGPGNNASIGFFTAGQLELQWLTFKLTTDANVAERVVTINYLANLVSMPMGSTAFAHVASTTFTYIAHQNTTLNTVGSVLDLFIPLPNARLIDNTGSIEIIVANIEAGDTITDINMIWKLWQGIGD